MKNFQPSKDAKSILRRYLCLGMGWILLLCFDCSRESTPEHSLFVQEASWPIFRGNTALTGVAEGHLGKLQLIWSYQTRDQIKSSPVIGWGNVYVGSSDDHLYCLSLAAGDSLWAFATGDDVEAPPLLIDSTLAVVRTWQ